MSAPLRRNSGAGAARVAVAAIPDAHAEVLRALRDTHAVLNAERFGGRLAPAIIRLRNLRGCRTGAFRDGAWREGAGHRAEIALAIPLLRDPARLVETLAHLMVHQQCAEDAARPGARLRRTPVECRSYHDGAFGAAVRAAGFRVPEDRQDQTGFDESGPGPALARRLSALARKLAEAIGLEGIPLEARPRPRMTRVACACGPAWMRRVLTGWRCGACGERVEPAPAGMGDA